MGDSLVGIQEDNLDSLHGDLSVHGKDVDVLLGHLQFTLHQVPGDLREKRHSAQSTEIHKQNLNVLKKYK